MAQANSNTRKARSHHKLTQAKVDGFTGKNAGRYHDSTVHNLALNVGTSGSKSWYLRYKARDGKQQSFRIGSTAQFNVKEARTKARKLLGQIAGGYDPAAEKRALKQDAIAAKTRSLRLYLNGDYWGKHLKGLDKGGSRNNGTAILKRIESVYEDLLDRDMATITADELNDLRTARKDTGRAMSTLNRDRICIHGLFEHAVKAGVISFNPANKNDHVPYKKKVADSKRVRFLGQRDEYETHPQGERQRFMTALNDCSDQLQTIINIALNTGFRRYEILSLVWGDVSLANNTITVRAENAKSREERTVPINPVLLKVLKAWKTKQGNVVNIKSLVFPSAKTGDVIYNIKRQWNKLIEDAQIEDFHFHDQRHDFASRLIEAGFSLEVIAELLGHADLTMAKRYSHIGRKTLANAVGSLG